eukprot:jgi/Psemu1/14893/gm1.14893_g
MSGFPSPSRQHISQYYVAGKIDGWVNEQYLANASGTKENHLQNAHASAFLDIISDLVLGSARKRGVKAEPNTSSDSWSHHNKLSLAPMDPLCFLCNPTLKKAPPIKTSIETPLEPRPWTLINTPCRLQEPPKDATPAFDILDFVGPKLTYKDDSEVVANMKVNVSDHGESGKETRVQGQKVQKEDD